MFNRQKFYRVFGHNSKGFSLIEVIVALALLGIIGVVFFGGLATASKAIFIADERATAESLARSQMESIKNEPYIYYSENPHGVYGEITPPLGYSIGITVVPFDPDTGVPYEETEGVFVQDDGIQKITVMIYHPEEEIEENIVITLEDYKVDR